MRKIGVLLSSGSFRSSGSGGRRCFFGTPFGFCDVIDLKSSEEVTGIYTRRVTRNLGYNISLPRFLAGYIT